MNKEKEIKELYDEIYADIAIQFGAGDYIEDGDRESLARQIVEHLQTFGYRKADEVKKETAREILYFLKGYITDGLLKNHEILNALIEHYGVEV